jgi:HEAT repeat protein
MSFEHKKEPPEQELWQLAQLLQSEDSNKRRRAAEALAELDDVGAIEPLLVSLTSNPNSLASANALVKFGEPALLALLDKLVSSESLELKQAIIQVLSVMPDERAIAPLIAIAKNVEHELRLTALYALSRYNNSRLSSAGTINRLFLELVSNDPDLRVRQKVALHLGERWPKNLEAVDPLIAPTGAGR